MVEYGKSEKNRGHYWENIMTKQEFEDKRREINIKAWNDSQKIINETKENGDWIGGLGTDPPEIKRIHEEAYLKTVELYKQLEGD